MSVARESSVARLEAVLPNKLSDISGAQKEQFQRDEIIHKQGAPVNYVRLVTKGFVFRIFECDEASDEQENVLDLHGEGDVLGLVGIFDPAKKYRDTAKAQSGTVTTLTFPEANFTSFCRDHDEFRIRLIKDRVMQYERDSSRAAILTHPYAEERIRQIFFKLSQRFGEVDGSIIRLPISLSRTDIGLLVGLTRESVSRAMQDFIVRRKLKCLPGIPASGFQFSLKDFAPDRKSNKGHL